MSVISVVFEHDSFQVELYYYFWNFSKDKAHIKQITSSLCGALKSQR
jgi:hypothetical protein